MKIPNYFNKAGIGEIVSTPNFLVTENNLTSNTSNPNYKVSQRSTASSYDAWKAMDGNNETFARTLYQQGTKDWWQIEFTTPVLLKGIKLYSDNESSYGVFLEASNDGVTWEVIDPIKFPDVTETERFYEFTTPYMFYRLISEVMYYYIQIYQVQFYYKPVKNYLYAEDQKLILKLNQYFQYAIQYQNFATTYATFNIVEGTLPEGISFNKDTGTFSGTPTSLGENNLVVEVSNSFKKMRFDVIIKIIQYNTTPHNLTSNTSDLRYILSQSSNIDQTRLAYYAMNGDGAYSHTGTEVNSWWQIEFTEGPAFVYQIKHVNADTTIASYYTSELKLLCSNDGISFEEIQAFTLNGTPNTTTIIGVNTEKPYRFYRIQNNSSQSKYLILSEIEFLYDIDQNYLIANENQTFTLIENIEKTLKIQYQNFSETPATFRIIEGILPEGISFDEATGIFSGATNFIGEVDLIVEITNTFYTIEVAVKISISEYTESESDPIITDGLTYFMPFTNSYTIPYLGSHLTIQGEEQPTIENDEKIQGILVPRNTALYDDQGQYWTLPASNGLIPDLSFSFWFKPATLSNGAWQSIFGIGKIISMSDGYAIIIQQNNNNLRLEFAGHYNASLGTVQLGKWYHICGTISNNLLTIYINNTQKLSRSRGTKMVSVHYICINQNMDLLEPCNNTFFISSLRIYNRALAAEEVTELFQEYTL